MVHCCVVFCSKDSSCRDRYFKETGNNLHFHQFPQPVQRRKEWVVAIRRDEGKNFKVCADIIAMSYACAQFSFDPAGGSGGSINFQSVVDYVLAKRQRKRRNGKCWTKKWIGRRVLQGDYY